MGTAATVSYNGRPVRVSFEDGTLYFVWADIAKAIGLPDTVIRRIPKTVFEFEKKILRGTRTDGRGTANILAVNYPGMYRLADENNQIPDRQRLKDWLVCTYSEQGAKFDAGEKRLDSGRHAEEPDHAPVFDRDPDAGPSFGTPVSDADLLRMAQKNLDIIGMLVERRVNQDERQQTWA